MLFPISLTRKKKNMPVTCVYMFLKHPVYLNKFFNCISFTLWIYLSAGESVAFNLCLFNVILDPFTSCPNDDGEYANRLLGSVFWFVFEYYQRYILF